MKKEDNKKKMKLTTKFMVATSDDIFGESVVTDVSLWGELKEEKEQLFVFKGEEHFDTELEAIEFIQNTPEVIPAIIQKVFVWEVA